MIFYLFSIGSMLCLFSPYSPGVVIAGGVLLAIMSLVNVRIITFFLFIAIGAMHSFFSLYLNYGGLGWLDQMKKECVVTGTVTSIPSMANHHLSFDFKTEKFAKKYV